MKIGLLCGEKTIDIELPESAVLLEISTLEALLNPTGAVRQALSYPIGSPPLKNLARGKKDACVVISDITRPVPHKIILSPILETLEEGGIAKEDITILIATGMHRPNQGDELESMVGREIVDDYFIVNHDCRNPQAYRKIDEIDGVPIEINTNYLDADLKILTGLIEPHFYAGYSGGRKSILPGISSFETMKFMHSYKMIDHPNVTNCLLEGNPFHEYALRVTEIVGVDFILNVVINRERKIAGVFAGNYDLAHKLGCEMVREYSVIDLDKRFDLVITSGGGYPLDATFYQVSKALTCARHILKKGGTIVVASECREGLGSPEFRGVIQSACGHEGFVKKFSDPENLVIDQWCAQNIYQALDHADQVYVYSPHLSYDDLDPIGALKIEGLQETITKLLKTHQNTAVAPHGPYVVGMVK
jgi:nickel-dependent lactate racemase